MSRPGGLGRGLSALIPTSGGGPGGLLTLRRSEVLPNPRQPRTTFSEEGLRELAASLRHVGMLQPILVRPRPDGRYEIVAGERRFRAAGLAGLETVPAVVRHTADDQLLTEALVENVHRADLSPLEEAAAYQQLMSDFGMTHEALAERLGKSRSAITNTVRLLGLARGVQDRLATGALSAGHARALLGVDDDQRQESLAQRVVADGLSVRATEELVRAVAAEPRDPQQALAGATARARPRGAGAGALERRLGDALATTVRVVGSSRRGRIVIDYAGREDLERLLAILERATGHELLDDHA